MVGPQMLRQMVPSRKATRSHSAAPRHRAGERLVEIVVVDGGLVSLEVREPGKLGRRRAVRNVACPRPATPSVLVSISIVVPETRRALPWRFRPAARPTPRRRRGWHAQATALRAGQSRVCDPISGCWGIWRCCRLIRMCVVVSSARLSIVA
jgi:hypothetical protein